MRHIFRFHSLWDFTSRKCPRFGTLVKGAETQAASGVLKLVAGVRVVAAEHATTTYQHNLSQSTVCSNSLELYSMQFYLN